MHLANPHPVLAATVVAWVTNPAKGADRARILLVADCDPGQDEECMVVDRVLLAHAYRVAALLMEWGDCVGLTVDVNQPDRTRTAGCVRTATGREEVFALAIDLEWVDIIGGELAEWVAIALSDTRPAWVDLGGEG